VRGTEGRGGGRDGGEKGGMGKGKRDREEERGKERRGRYQQRRRGPLIRVGMLIWEFPLV